jgi:hypothetical protein
LRHISRQSTSQGANSVLGDKPTLPLHAEETLRTIDPTGNAIEARYCPESTQMNENECLDKYQDWGY